MKMKSLLLLLSFFCVKFMMAQGYYGVFNSQVYARINGQTFKVDGTKISVNGAGPFVLQAIFVQTEKWVQNGGSSNVCGGSVDFAAAGGNSGAANLSYNSGFTEFNAGNNVVQEWQAININQVLSNDDGVISLTLDFHILGSESSFSSCSQNKDFTFSSLLPLTITHIRAIAKEDENLIEWSTHGTNANNRFEIMGSKDGKVWESRGELNPSELFHERDNDFSFSDIGIQYKGIRYYKIIEIDANDQKFESPIVVLRKDHLDVTSSLVYPNPSSGEEVVVYYQNAGAANAALLTVFDFSGKALETRTISLVEGENNFILPTSGWKTGPVSVIIQDSDGLKLRETVFRL
ncbi:MAG: T9SS type A sorting domain-containing protein [Saprospiraceae bacterium]|nr:T9SS type A sorting domain-containing protein [Saprospiraceae bacterium]